VFDLLAGLAASGTTVAFITHDRHLAGNSDRLIEMLDGAVDRHQLLRDRAHPGSNGSGNAPADVDGLDVPMMIGAQ
jgi:ABC-type siderophore export system fused ATPase/permease subunit